MRDATEAKTECSGSEKPHAKLRLWQKSVDLVTELYKVTRSFPSDEEFGITAQMRRAAVSIPSNIAEGAARRSRREFQQFLFIARGSLSELDTQLVIAARLGYIKPEIAKTLRERLDELSMMLNGLVAYLAK
jgi:four helix bundle protein